MGHRLTIAIATATVLTALTPAIPSFAASNDVPALQSGVSAYDVAPLPASVDRMALARLAPITPVTATPQRQAMPRKAFGVFKSTAISAAKLPAASKWNRVSRVDYSPLFGDNCADSGLAGCDTTFARSLRKVSATASSQSPRAAIDLINQSVNAAIVYRSDTDVWGEGDHWATPSEIAKKGAGDCEDFAIAKYWMLRSAGFSPAQLQVVVLRDTRRQLFHAVLVAHIEGGSYVLDNVSNRLATDDSYGSYRPIMSFADGRNFIHGFSDASNRNVAAVPSNLSTIAPGESM